jgi:hypothetical protein
MCSYWAVPCAECTIWLCNICRAVSSSPLQNSGLSQPTSLVGLQERQHTVTQLEGVIAKGPVGCTRGGAGLHKVVAWASGVHRTGQCGTLIF